MIRMIFTISALSSLVLVGPVAAAQPSRPVRPVVVAAPPQACVPLCPGDYAPCDPPYFKTSDDRCTWERRRR